MQCVTGADAADKLTKAPQSSSAPSHKEHDHVQ
jgi:hypothetical protein